ncbi:MAG TPA: sigma-70 family RNA polymerase sigma factor [Gaiellaceae bacterium]|jgi:RNA polymerase sigma factor (sigma-70 family)|nr:sigma-70 family RNA polymerase sigma factor [Gaiellaceae bacterium]HWJ44480.1 sigma-70 family RNA polymerase sigma factor [Gaiellaceae bacterium]
MTPLLAQRPRSDRAFERMYKRHVGDVYRYALAVMRNPADAEDVTQTTFLNAYRAYAEKGDRPEKPQNWLIAIAHNVCRQRFRQSARRPSEVAFEDDIADTIPEETAPTGEDIRRALGHLAFNQRAALVMRELEGRSYAEIAEILELSTSAVETLIFRARRALREQLEGSLTCGDAEFAISRQLDGRLSRQERGQLRAHLRECSECATFARRQRAQRGALRSLVLVPVPGSLTSFFGGGGAAVGTGVALKAAAAVTAGVVIGGASVVTVKQVTKPKQARAAAPVFQSVAPDAVVPSPREHTPLLASSSGRAVRVTKAHAAKADTGKARGRGKAVKARKSRGRALGRQKKYDASVSSRHVRGAQRAHPVHPAANVRTQTRRAPKPKPLRTSRGSSANGKKR